MNEIKPNIDKGLKGWIDDESKKMFRAALLLWLFTALVSLGGIAAVIYFIFWFLRHFNVI